MKYIILHVVIFVFVVSSIVTSQSRRNDDSYPSERISMHSDTTPGSNWIYPTIFNWNFEDVGNPGINNGSVGAMYFQNMFYFNRWNSNIIYRYDGGWNGPNSFLDSISYFGSIKDLTTDGEYLYGGTAKSIVYIFDGDGITLDSLILGSPAVARAIAYTPDEDGFYVCSYNDDIILCDAVTGEVIRDLTGTNNLKGKYGLAYSNLPDDGPLLWVWGQGSFSDPYNNLWKVNPLTGDTLAKFRFGPLPVQPGTQSLIGVAGGAEVCEINGESVLLLNFQNYALCGYRLEAPVPVELKNFTSNVIQNNIILNWSTATETNNYGFEIQRKTVNGNFRTIAFVKGEGTTIETHNYCFTDHFPDHVTLKYRLRQVDFNGHSEYSKELTVELSTPDKYELFQNFPNPFNPTTEITYNLFYDSKVILKIFNLIGQEIAELVNGEMSLGIHSIKFDASKLASGIYLYKLDAVGFNGSKFTSWKKMIVIK